MTKAGLLRRFAPLNDDKTQMLSSTNSRHTPRKRVASTPRLLGSITASLEYWIARSSRAMTAESAARNDG
jgi:hypothetical protein